LTQGTWKYNSWGLPFVSSPTGAEMWIIFKEGLPEETMKEYWLQSSRTISGLFGLSIDLASSPNTVKPVDRVQTSLEANSTGRLFYASMPNEIVCTENLTPWIKLLPCDRQRGIATLFTNSHRLFDSQYFSLSLHFRKRCADDECKHQTLILKQTLDVVYNPKVLTKKYSKEVVEFDVKTFFQQTIQNVCPLANISNVYVDLGPNSLLNVDPLGELVHSKLIKRNLNVYNLKKLLKNENAEFNPTITLNRKVKQTVDSFFSMHRYLTDMNERYFGIRTVIKSEHSANMSIVYFDTIPWYFRVYISSLEIRNDDTNQLLNPGIF
jgi:GPI-anchor transamidase subunit T